MFHGSKLTFLWMIVALRIVDRLSAYGVLIPLLITVPFIGAAESDWALGNTNFWVRIVGVWGGLGRESLRTWLL
jgi:hypothetical protein